jgi:hypothetical protein
VPLAPPWLDAVVDLPAVPLNHGVKLVVPTALEQIRLDRQDAASAGVEGVLCQHQVAPSKVGLALDVRFVQPPELPQ